MASLPQIQARDCSTCRKPAVFACKECKDAPWSDDIKSRYCSDECRKSDRNRHENGCSRARSRLTIQLIAFCLREMFLDFRGVTYTTRQPVVNRVEEKDGKILVHFESLDSDPSSPDLAIDIVRGFPESVARKLSKECFEGVIMRSACREYPTWMLDLTQHAFGSAQVKIYEVEIATKLGPNIILVDSSGGVLREHPRHEIYKIVLANGEAYAFDPTCAQYGYFIPIVPWDEYESTRIEEVLQTTCIEDGRVRTEQMISRLKTAQTRFLWPRIHKDLCSRKLIGWFREWENSNMPFEGVVRLREAATAWDKIVELLNFVRAQLQTYVSTGLAHDVTAELEEARATLCPGSQSFESGVVG